MGYTLENVKASAAATKKGERVAVRLSARAKSVLERAAHVRGNTLSEFVLNSALNAAQTTIDENERMTLSEADRDVFLAALDNPPEPNEALREAAVRYRDAVE